jgi:hypothetical protein
MGDPPIIGNPGSALVARQVSLSYVEYSIKLRWHARTVGDNNLKLWKCPSGSYDLVLYSVSHSEYHSKHWTNTNGILCPRVTLPLRGGLNPQVVLEYPNIPSFCEPERLIHA